MAESGTVCWYRIRTYVSAFPDCFVILLKFSVYNEASLASVPMDIATSENPILLNSIL